MIEKLHKLMFEPHCSVRYVGRHRAPSPLPMIAASMRRSRDASIA